MHRCLLMMSLGLLFACAQPARADFISQVLGDNPIGFWILNDVPGPTTTAIDSSVNGFNGTYGPGVTPQGIAGPSWVPPSGLVADFTGGTISFPTPLNLGANGYTIEAWINPSLSSLTQTTRIVASGNGFGGYGFGTASGGGLVFTSFSSAGLLHNGGDTAAEPVAIRGGRPGCEQRRQLLRERIACGERGRNTADHAPTGNFTIGNQSPGLGHTDEIFTGGLAGISVYDTALTSAQIQAQYNAATAATVPEPSSLVLTGLGAFCAGCTLRRRRRKASSSVPR